MLSAARIEQLYPIKTGMDSPNTKISRGNWSLVVVRKFIAECIISYRNGNENSGILLTNRESRLQNRTFIYKWGFLGYKWDSRVTIYQVCTLIYTKCTKTLHLNCWQLPKKGVYYSRNEEDMWISSNKHCVYNIRRWLYVYD